MPDDYTAAERKLILSSSAAFHSRELHEVTAIRAGEGQLHLRASRRPGRLRREERSTRRRPHLDLGQGQGRTPPGCLDGDKPARESGARTHADSYPHGRLRDIAARSPPGTWSTRCSTTGALSPDLEVGNHRRHAEFVARHSNRHRGGPGRRARLQRLQRRAPGRGRSCSGSSRSSGIRAPRWVRSASRVTGNQSVHHSTTSTPCSPR